MVKNADTLLVHGTRVPRQAPLGLACLLAPLEWNQGKVSKPSSSFPHAAWPILILEQDVSPYEVKLLHPARRNVEKKAERRKQHKRGYRF